MLLLSPPAIARRPRCNTCSLVSVYVSLSRADALHRVPRNAGVTPASCRFENCLPQTSSWILSLPATRPAGITRCGEAWVTIERPPARVDGARIRCRPAALASSHRTGRTVRHRCAEKLSPACSGVALDETPAHAFAFAVSQKADESVLLVAIERIDRVVQTPLGILIQLGSQRIVDPRAPTLLLKRGQDRFLVRCRHFELFHDDPANAQLLPIRVPRGSRSVRLTVAERRADACGRGMVIAATAAWRSSVKAPSCRPFPVL